MIEKEEIEVKEVETETVVTPAEETKSVTFSQAEMDRIISKKLNKVRQEYEQKLQEGEILHQKEIERHIKVATELFDFLAPNLDTQIVRVLDNLDTISKLEWLLSSDGRRAVTREIPDSNPNRKETQNKITNFRKLI